MNDAAGYSIHATVLNDPEVSTLVAALADTSRSRAGARHLLGVPAVVTLASDPRLRRLASDVLGAPALPFRATLFDKSQRANWQVGWHQDTALPLRDRTTRPGWGPWSVKLGVPYAHAPASALQSIVALRVHLDASNPGNGPLRVIPGSHVHGVLEQAELNRLVGEGPVVECLAPRGGVVVMRPLLVHSSPKASSSEPRRVLHLEYATTLSLGSDLALRVV
jgi:ectoine hydroxylase-related dioxygenase (phytanoyl-CoA dioxygenase family)